MHAMPEQHQVGQSDAQRAFVALELPVDLKARLGELQTRLRPHLPGLRWAAASSLHLTLRFLGDSTPQQIAALARQLAAAAARCPAARAPLTGLGMFPERGAPRTLWAGVSLPPTLVALQRSCEDAARLVGCEAETRPFTAHLTLGRWRERVARPELPAVELGAADLTRVTLYRSELRTSGAVHTPLHVFELAPAQGSTTP